MKKVKEEPIKVTETFGNKKDVNKAAMPALSTKSKAIKKADKENFYANKERLKKTMESDLL